MRIVTLALVAAVLACGPPQAPSPPARHLVLVTVDTLRADRLGAYGSELAQESIVFRYAFAPAPFTLPSLTALVTGRYPDAIGVRSNAAVLQPAVLTLAERLRSLGFRTGAVVSNFVARRQSGLDQGFEHYDDRMHQREGQRLMPERRAARTTTDALALLDELRDSGERVFLWVHYQDPHGPYTAPGEHRAQPGPPPPGVRDQQLPLLPAHHGYGGIPRYQQLDRERHSSAYRAAYHAEIRFLDAQLGALFAGLRARGLWEETALTVTADHGEGLGEEGHWFAHSELLSPAETAVPLLLRVPGRGAAVRDDLASLLDLVPTLLSAVGAPVAEPSAEAPGRDLLARGAERGESALLQSNLGEGIHARRALLRDGHQYEIVRSHDGRAGDVLRRLDGSEARDPALRQQLRAELRELEAQLARSPEVRQDLGELDRARLQALGYLLGEEP